MKLYYSINSPYARKCRVVLREKNLLTHVEELNVTPLENPVELQYTNPLGTVPALITDKELPLCDSKIICEFLDAQNKEPVLYPTGADHFPILSQAALADGIIDGAVYCVVERRKPEIQQSAYWLDRKEDAIKRCLTQFEAALPKDALDISTITLAIALSYLNFRLPHLDWATRRANLNAWHQRMEERASMIQTQPKA